MLSLLSLAIFINGAVVSLMISTNLVVTVILIIRIINDIGPCYPTLSFVISDIIALHTKLISSRPIKRVIFQLTQSILTSEPPRRGASPQTRTND